jgi:hypothetical protein
MVPLFRELAKMRYPRREPVRLDQRRPAATLGEEPRTRLDRAVRDTLIGLGCLPAEPTEAAAGPRPSLRRRPASPRPSR